MSLRAKHTANRLKQDVVEFLESMGIVWRKRDARMSFADKIEVLSTYTQQTNKTLAEVKGDEIFKFEGRNIQISKWLTLFRMAYNNGELSPRQIDELENLGIMWDGIKTRHNLHFNTLVEVLEQYASEHGGSIRNAKKNEAYYYNGEKFPLKDIVYRLQGRYAEILTDEQKSRLTAIGLVFIDYRDYKIEVLQQYCNQFGSIEDIIITEKFEYKGHVESIGRWVRMFRTQYKQDQLDERLVKRLEDLGMVWDANYKKGRPTPSNQFK